MKVLQVLPELNSGGVERGTLELAQHLVEQGHESLVISGGGRLVTQLEQNGSRHITLPVGKKSLRTLKLIRPIRRLLEELQPDILHLRSRVPAWVCWLAWRKLPETQRPRLVTTVHGFYSVSRWSQVMCRGERVICVSDSIRDYVQTNYPSTNGGLLRVIPRGVAPTTYPYGFEASEEWTRQFHGEFPETRGKSLLTLPGRITRLKGHEDLIHIMSALCKNPRIHGLVVGGAHPKKAAYLDELHQKVAEAGLSDRITFTGNRDDLREILSITHLVLSLTRQPESFGRTTLEALAMGIPVAGYAHGGVAEQLDALFPEGRLPALDPVAATPIIKRLMEHTPAVRKPNPFTLDKMLEDTVAVYRELLSDSA
ncbi:glycosyltransferase family 4 protein [Haloferula rosea]|uniref:Glycosyltransferase family 4 protein n=1 Tax=Haloferula rosea TaxID=490093 RepID=A0A934RFB2_9BACT|nr:glycosyltransferase family 4 protein [Haloferula rosea]MBK1827496.1 glycosyltransferase family 4 protein [Haloferula rosea]